MSNAKKLVTTALLVAAGSASLAAAAKLRKPKSPLYQPLPVVGPVRPDGSVTVVRDGELLDLPGDPNQDKYQPYVPTPRDPYIVYETGLKGGKAKGAEAVADVLRRLKPNPPQRVAAFASLDRQDSPVKWNGWNIQIDSVEPTEDGWVAGVTVSVQATTSDGGHAVLHHRHVERYEFSNGELTYLGGQLDELGPPWHFATM